jgi:hypothetical protein
MALRTDHERLSSSCRHDLHPERFGFAPFDVDIFERSDMVNFNSSFA